MVSRSERRDDSFKSEYFLSPTDDLQNRPIRREKRSLAQRQPINRLGLEIRLLFFHVNLAAGFTFGK